MALPLAFADPEHQKLVRIGVMTGSLLSGTCGAIVLAIAARRARTRDPEMATSSPIG